MKIGIIGLSDKRHIIYTLVRVLGGLSNTIIFTPNKQYLQMSEDLLTDFELNDVRVVVYDCDIDELDEEEYELSTYEFVVYDILLDVPFGLDVALVMDNRERYLTDLEDRDLDNIPIFSVDAFTAEDAYIEEKHVKIPPASLVETIIQNMYKTRQITPIKNNNFNKGACDLVCSITKLKSGTVMPRLKKGVIDV